MQVVEWEKHLHNNNTKIITLRNQVLNAKVVQLELDSLLSFMIENLNELSNALADIEQQVRENPIFITGEQEREKIFSLGHDIKKKLIIQSRKLNEIIDDLNKIKNIISTKNF